MFQPFQAKQKKKLKDKKIIQNRKIEIIPCINAINYRCAFFRCLVITCIKYLYIYEKNEKKS